MSIFSRVKFRNRRDGLIFGIIVHLVILALVTGAFAVNFTAGIVMLCAVILGTSYSVYMNLFPKCPFMSLFKKERIREFLNNRFGQSAKKVAFWVAVFYIVKGTTVTVISLMTGAMIIDSIGSSSLTEILSGEIAIVAAGALGIFLGATGTGRLIESRN